MKSDTEFLRDLGVEIRIGRFRRGLSQDELAKMAEAGASTLGAIERGKHNFRVLTLKRLAEALGKDIKDLL